MARGGGGGGAGKSKAPEGSCCDIYIRVLAITRELRVSADSSKKLCLIQGSVKRWAPGCVNPASWLSLVVGASSRNLGATFLADPCTYWPL